MPLAGEFFGFFVSTGADATCARNSTSGNSLPDISHTARTALSLPICWITWNRSSVAETVTSARPSSVSVEPAGTLSDMPSIGVGFVTMFCRSSSNSARIGSSISRSAAENS